MSGERNDGGSAFPLPIGPAGDMAYEGISMRDYFAAKAMAALIVGDGWTVNPSDAGVAKEHRQLAREAYMIADAMLKRREQ